MSASHFPVIGASAREAVRALARYERHVRRLAATWLDMDLYQTVSQEIDDIKGFCGLVPELALPWASLLVSHADLVHALWRSGQAGGAEASPEVAAKLAEHIGWIDSLARRCLRVVESSGLTVTDFQDAD
jgi:hypothetical protein